MNYPALLGIKLFNESNIIILTQIGILIYHFNENDESISLNYFNKEFLSTKKKLSCYKKLFSNPPYFYQIMKVLNVMTNGFYM
jgi:hypothetical protein